MPLNIYGGKDTTPDNFNIQAGGTNATTAAEALINLDGIASTDLGGTSGLATLNIQGGIEGSQLGNSGTSTVSIDGPVNVYVGLTYTFTINNYDSFADYTISVASGSFTRSGAVITYTAPGAVGLSSLSVNERVIPLSILNAAPGTPQLTSPVNGVVGLTMTFIATTSAFVPYGVNETHASSDWQISTNVGFTGIVLESLNDASHLTSWTVTGLLPLTSYFLRVRHRGSVNGVSVWSNVVSISTKAITLPVNELTKQVASDAVAGDTFGASVQISANGDKFVVGSPYDDVSDSGDCGSLYVYKKNGSTNTLEGKITATGQVRSMVLSIGSGGSVRLQTNSATLADLTYSTNQTVQVPADASQLTITGKGGTGSSTTTAGQAYVAPTAQQGLPGYPSGLPAYVAYNPGSAAIPASSYTPWTPVWIPEVPGRAAVYGWVFQGTTMSYTPASNQYLSIYPDTSGRPATGTPGQIWYSPPHSVGYVNYDLTTSMFAWVVVTAAVATIPGYYQKQYGQTVYIDYAPAVPATAQQGLPAYPSGLPVYVAATAGQPYIAPGTINSTGASTTVLINGQTYTFVGGTGGAATPTTQVIYTNAGDQFGKAVSISGDGLYVAGGAPNAKLDGLTLHGDVCVSTFSGGLWQAPAFLKPSDGETGLRFGTSVSLDATGSRIAIGAYPASLTGANNGGAVYIFVRAGTTWTQEAKLVAADKVIGDGFGFSVSLSSDGTRVVIGAPEADPSNMSDAGAAYVFTRYGSTWTQEAKLLANDKAAGDKFGVSVSISGNSNKVLVGANAASPNTVSAAGAGYVYTRSGTVWAQEAKLIAGDKAIGDNLGSSVSMSTDGNTAMIGAPGADPVAVTNAGAAYLFTAVGGTWSQESKIVASDKYTTDLFGCSVSISGDISRSVVGSFHADPGGAADAGAVYVFV